MDQQIRRILDANFNRAREAARVAEDFARFALDDAGLSAEAKGLRHALTQAFQSHDLGNALHDRGTGHDVGRSLRTDAEYERSGAAGVVRAATKRLAEALRCLEEYGKTVDIAFAVAIEQLRYRSYEFEQRLLGRLEAGPAFRAVRLYVIISEDHCRHDWLATAQAALEGGADCLQLREKHLPDAEILRRASQLTSACREHGALCLINDRPDVAVLAGADGVHLGQDDLPADQVRKVVGWHRIVGVSTHTPAQVEAAAQFAPDYIAVGPMFDSPTKPNLCLAGPETLRSVRHETTLPLVAIGGIDAERVSQVIDAGADAVCVCQAVIGQADVAAAARRIRQKFDAQVRQVAGEAHHAP